MIPVGTVGQVLAVYIFVVLLGGLGGLAASLLFRGPAGRLEMPRRGTRDGEKFYDFGFISEILLGIVAASAAMWLLDPGEMTRNGEVVPAYPAQAVIGVSVIAGAAGGALLAGIADRAKQVSAGKEAIMGRDTALIGMRMALDAAEAQSRVLARRGEFIDHPELQGAVPAATLEAIIDHATPVTHEETITQSAGAEKASGDGASSSATNGGSSQSTNGAQSSNGAPPKADPNGDPGEGETEIIELEVEEQKAD